METYTVGIDIGGTKTLICVANPTHEIILKKRISTTPCDVPETFFNRLFTELKLLLAEKQLSLNHVGGIGIGLPGVVDHETGYLTNAPALPWRDTDVEKLVKHHFKGKVLLNNDVNLAALGEQWIGAAKGVSNFLMITVGTGIGGALILNGELFQGVHKAAGEISHFVITDDETSSEHIYTEEFGSFETVTSGTGIGNRAREYFRKQRKHSLILSLVNHEIEKIGAKEVIEAAIKGDRVALDILEKPLNHMAIGVANIISLLDLEKVVIGGGVPQGGDFYIVEIAKRVRKYTPNQAKIIPASLGNEAGAIGGIAFILGKCRKQVYEMTI
ncbi:ROK family protein [Robertmurraya beringensis]|uniref:ROK family protein n=1 Tax=Robertmurraya beringensis TaxID=641660 RepID=A0ABV6KRZ1_9BACI